ncbi:type I restriction enzyme HsdR N-terminal domain-containing protein [Kovacikia minuta CCNUW1]|uniref:type I restriction enzyme HsdR N-terminal domain-containing protein n=1 Tax=Kovacikia minuta TaxID=2931930 RepID=UPI001CCEF10E|nr:type I restriction enzyme HsdR N-terminal domain-containing protein [Kovacikia minuta]UBF24348.1 type I restriction enzyme HsdR N-terminal domain-containing protein [Kovacikia minuta CCNUW1]
MAKTVAITEAAKSLAETEAKFGLHQSQDEQFFTEWATSLAPLTAIEQTELDVMRRRLAYLRSTGDHLEGAVTLLVASPLLEIAGFYDPPFRMQSETAIELVIDDGEEILRGRIDVLILQNQFWVLVVESKKTSISVRSALPPALAYMMANSNPDQSLFGMITNGDDVLFIKLLRQPTPQYGLSRAFSLYTLPGEAQNTLQILKRVGQLITRRESTD